MINVRVLKDWKGTVQVPAAGTVAALAAALAAGGAFGVDGDAAAHHVIARGRRLNLAGSDASTALAEAGIADGTAVMLVRRKDASASGGNGAAPSVHGVVAGADPPELTRMRRIEVIEAAARAVSERLGMGGVGGGRGAMRLEDQDGRAVAMDPADRKAFALGCLIYARGRQLLDACSQSLLCVAHSQPAQAGADVRMETEQEAAESAAVAVAPTTASSSLSATDADATSLEEALELFQISEGAFELLSPKWVSATDNVALCLLDSVWATLLLHSRDGRLANHNAPNHKTEDKAKTELGKAQARLGRAKGMLCGLYGVEMGRIAMREDAGAQKAVRPTE